MHSTNVSITNLIMPDSVCLNNTNTTGNQEKVEVNIKACMFFGSHKKLSAVRQKVGELRH